MFPVRARLKEREARSVESVLVAIHAHTYVESSGICNFFGQCNGGGHVAPHTAAVHRVGGRHELRGRRPRRIVASVNAAEVVRPCSIDPCIVRVVPPECGPVRGTRFEMRGTSRYRKPTTVNHCCKLKDAAKGMVVLHTREPSRSRSARIQWRVEERFVVRAPNAKRQPAVGRQ